MAWLREEVLDGREEGVDGAERRRRSCGPQEPTKQRDDQQPSVGRRRNSRTCKLPDPAQAQKDEAAAAGGKRAEELGRRMRKRRHLPITTGSNSEIRDSTQAEDGKEAGMKGIVFWRTTAMPADRGCGGCGSRQITMPQRLLAALEHISHSQAYNDSHKFFRRAGGRSSIDGIAPTRSAKTRGRQGCTEVCFDHKRVPSLSLSLLLLSRPHNRSFDRLGGAQRAQGFGILSPLGQAEAGDGSAMVASDGPGTSGGGSWRRRDRARAASGQPSDRTQVSAHAQHRGGAARSAA